jgi:hypothetical protein
MSWIRFVVLSLCAMTPSAALALDYRIVQVASGLSQPNYVMQAPGDPSNILYYTERASNAVAGFNPVNHMGRVMRYDTAQSATPGYVGTPIIDLSSRNIINDDGLEGVAFSPDFRNPGTPGFGKIYVSSSQYNGSGTVPTNRVEEYTTTSPASPTTANTTLTRTILQYSNNSQNNHTIDWIGFDPTAAGEARNYLYISTGNASFGLPYGNATSPGGMPSQNPSDVRGKILRVDVNPTLPNSYQGIDSSKNFNIPVANPIPTYLSSHPGTLRGPGNTAPLGEVYVTGTRNAYRVSFDRSNGNMYFGDVGETTVEEVDFLKAGSNNGANPPVDFGWPQREGTTASNTDPMDAGLGYPTGVVNPFTGVTQLNPIQQFLHNGVSRAVIGGYVYRGPVASLRGQYFYSDFVQGTVNSLVFDPNTDPGTFNGNNGTLTDDSALFRSLLGNPAGGLGHIASYGEDNSGNLYIVNFGGNSGDSGFGNATGEYPSAGLGQIFEIVPVPEPATNALVFAALTLFFCRRCFRARVRGAAIVIGLLIAVALCLPRAATATTVWSAGPNDLSFSKPAWDAIPGDGGDPTLAVNQDRITNSVWLTRAASKALFNAKTETGFNDAVDPAMSPADTQWAFSGSGGNPTFAYGAGAAEHEMLTFNYFENALGGSHALLPNILTRAGVLHLLTDDIYIDIQFMSWQRGSTGPPSGAFAYTRATAPVPEPATFAMLALGAGIGLLSRTLTRRLSARRWYHPTAAPRGA